MGRDFKVDGKVAAAFGGKSSRRAHFRIVIQRKKRKRISDLCFLCGAYKEGVDRLSIVSVVWASLTRMMTAVRFLDGFAKMPHADFREFQESQGSNFTKCWERRLTEAINDAGFVEVVRRHFDFDAVSDGQSDESLPHLAGDVSEHHVTVVQFDAEHSSRQDCFDFAFQFDVTFHPLM